MSSVNVASTFSSPPAVQGRCVTTRILHTFEDQSWDLDNWQRVLSSGDTNTIFLTPEYQRAWWELFGRGKLLMIVAQQEGEPVALAPLLDAVYHVGRALRVGPVEGLHPHGGRSRRAAEGLRYAAQGPACRSEPPDSTNWSLFTEI